MDRDPTEVLLDSQLPAKRQYTRSHYELSNHLGNVLATVTGRKLGIDINNNGSGVDYYKSEIVQASDYYPFGSEMPKRTYRNMVFDGTNKYRYGFNGKELDKSGEFGSLTHYDYGFRIYNPSIGKFLSVDPLTKSYPMLTPYQFSSNTPIQAIDLDGLEAYHFTYVKGDDGKSELALIDVQDLYSYSYDLLGYLHGGLLMTKSIDNSKQEYFIHDYYKTFTLTGIDTHDKVTKFKSLEELEKADPSTTTHKWHEKISHQIVAAASYSMPSSSNAKVGNLRIPHGFKSLGMVKQFATQIQAGLSRIGFKNTKIYLQGSAVKGADDAGRAFDVGRKSDFDVALTGDDIWTRAESLGITSTTKSSVIKAGSDEAKNLGIDDLLNQVSSKFGRPVDVMIFKNVEEVKRKGASIRLVSEIERK